MWQKQSHKKLNQTISIYLKYLPECLFCRDCWKVRDIYCFPKQHFFSTSAISGKESINSMAVAVGSQDPNHSVTSVTK